jgi:VanZ family protein
MVVYGLLAVLVTRACRITWPGRLTAMQLLLVGVAFSTFYGMSDEWHQTFVASRHGSTLDVLADFLGSLIGAAGYVSSTSAGKGRPDGMPRSG